MATHDSPGEGPADRTLDEPDRERVWIAPSSCRGSSCYHTDRTCRHVTDAFRPVTLAVAERGHALAECRRCAGTVAPSDGSRGHYEALLAAADDGSDE